MSEVRHDQEVKFLVDRELFLALRRLAEADDRSLSNYMRHVARNHVREHVRAFDRRGTGDSD